MSMFSKHIDIPYANSPACMETLAGIEAIDFFFAQHILASYANVPAAKIYNKEDIKVLFHILLALSYFQRQGHICINIQALAGQTLFTQARYQKNQSSISASQELCVGYQFPSIEGLVTVVNDWVDDFHQCTQDTLYVVFENGYLYSKRYFYYEQYFCQYLQNSFVKNSEHSESNVNTIAQSNIRAEFTAVFDSPLIQEQHADMQQVAVLNALFNNFSIITGGAGTGKTYTVARLVLIFSKVFSLSVDQIELVAPTGKAANRLIESFQQELSLFTGNDALTERAKVLKNMQSKTLHRLLKIDPTTGIPRFNKQHKLPTKVLIIDEASMIDISLMHKVIEALEHDTKLILVGDANQLPSVESGSLLSDLVLHPKSGMSSDRKHVLTHLYPELNESELLLSELSVTDDAYNYVSRLTASRRSSKTIQTFAESILNGQLPTQLYYSETADVGLLIQDFSDKATSLKSIVNKYVLPHFVDIQQADSLPEAFNKLKSYAFLSPFREGPFGVNAINALVEEALSVQFSHVKVAQLYKGMPIMILQNDYQLGLFNGDVGIIWPNEQGKLTAYFASQDAQFSAVPLFGLPSIQATYAMTIHKTQGSEYQELDLLLPPQGEDFLSRELVYTGVTRAKRKVVIHTTKSIFENAIQKNIARVSGIDKRLA